MKGETMKQIAVLLLIVCISSCSGDSKDGQQTDSTARTSNENLFAGMVLAEKPDGAIPLREALAEGTFDQEVVVSGKVGEITPGYAAFRLFDYSLQDCNREGDHCKTPWDYCCESSDRIRDGSVFVEFKDDRERMIKADIINFRDIYHLAKVDVKGLLSRDESGNIFLTATGIHVHEKSPLDVAHYERRRKARN
jgi:hypothetical protein